MNDAFRVPEEIKAKLPLEELVKKLGIQTSRENSRYLYCHCPFHDDNTPSFVVDKSWQNAKCFSASCGDLGSLNHISLIQHHQHLSRELAIDYLYQLTGEDRPLNTDYDILRKAAERLHANITMPEPYAFFQARGIRSTALDKLLVGYSPSFQWFKEAMKDIPPDQAARLELYRQELFNNAIVYPLFDAMGRVSGFRCRPFGSGIKYIGNSSQFKLRPSRVYGIHLVNKAQQQIVLVEGQNDVLGMLSAGFTNVAGSMGTNLDNMDKYLEDHGFTDIVFIADGDSPGWTAALKAPNLIKVTQIPEEGKDPDEYIREHGLLKMLELVSEAKYPVEIKLASRLGKAPSSFSQKISLVKHIARELSDGLPPILISIMKEKIAGALGIVRDEVDQIFSLVELDSEQLEHKIIYHLSVSGPLVDDIKGRVTPKMFMDIRMRKCAETLWQGLSLTDSVGKMDGLTDGDISKFMEIHRRRQVKGELSKIAYAANNLSDPIDDLVVRAIGKLADASTEEVEIMEATDLIRLGLNNIEERVSNPGKIPISFGSGFPKLDMLLQGVRPNAMYVLAATQGVGKSALAFEWALDMACRQKIPTLWVSLEMSRSEMADRAMSKLSGIAASQIQMGSLTDQEVGTLREKMLQYAQSPLYYVDTGAMNINQIVALSRKLKMSKGIQVVFIDYLQLVEGGTRDASMYERIGYISRMIKSGICMDKSVGLPVIAVAQLSKLAAKVEVPTAEYIAESYKVAQDADAFLAIRRRTESEIADDALSHNNYGNVLLHLDKNRTGLSKVKIGLQFDINTLVFKEVLS